jgi:ankyrin repeat protein
LLFLREFFFFCEKKKKRKKMKKILTFLFTAILLDVADIDVTKGRLQGDTPLQIAARQGRRNAVKMLAIGSSARQRWQSEARSAQVDVMRRLYSSYVEHSSLLVLCYRASK